MQKIPLGFLRLHADFFLKDRKERKDYATLFTDYIYFSSVYSQTFPEFPIRVAINLTDQCNLNCAHCFRKAFRKYQNNNKPLTTSEWENLFRQFAEHGVIRIFITGGEPFLHPDFIKIVATLKKYKLLVGIATNCTLVTTKKAHQLSNLLDKWDYIQVSIDTLKGDNRMRKCNPWLLKRNIALLKERNIPLKANVTVTSLNYQEMLDIFKFCEEVGIRNISFSPLFETETNEALRIMDEIDLLIKFDEVLKYAKKNQTGIRILQSPLGTDYPIWYILKYKYNFNLPNEMPRFICPIGITDLCISSCGDVFPCPYLEFPGFIIGNIRSNSVYELWKHSVILNKLRKRVVTIDKKNPCPVSNLCNRGCLAQSYHRYTVIDKCDPRCLFVRNPKILKELT